MTKIRLVPSHNLISFTGRISEYAWVHYCSDSALEYCKNLIMRLRGKE